MVSQKLLEFAKSLVTDFKVKSAKSSEILLKICYLIMIKKKPIKLYNLIFRFALVLTKHGLKKPVLTNTLFCSQFSFRQHFEQPNCSLLRFFCMTHISGRSLSNSCMLLCSRTMFSDKHNLSISSAVQYFKSGLCNLKLCVTFVSMQELLHSYLSAFAGSYVFYAHIVSL